MIEVGRQVQGGLVVAQRVAVVAGGVVDPPKTLLGIEPPVAVTGLAGEAQRVLVVVGGRPVVAPRVVHLAEAA